MKIIKHNGNGQTYCVGCLAAGRQPLTWDSMITEIHYDDDTKVGCFCPSCFKKVCECLNIKE